MIDDFELRTEKPVLLEDAALRAVVRNASRKLRNRLGPGYPLAIEEISDPCEPEAEPALFLLVQIHETDERAQNEIDKFISEEWAAEPASIRRVFRVGSEFGVGAHESKYYV